MMPLALEIQNRVDDMLERLRPREVAVFGNVTDENGRNVLPFRGKQKLRGGFTDLPDAARRRLELDGKNRLYRIDDDERGLEASDFFEDAFDARFRKQVEGRCTDAQPVAAALDLVLGFLARRIEDWSDVGGEMGCRLQQQRRLANARFATEQHERTRHDAPAQDAIELPDAG